MNKMTDKLYFHSDKASMHNTFEEVCERNNTEVGESVATTASYVGYQVEIDGYWTETGKFYATHLMGIPLEREVAI